MKFFHTGEELKNRMVIALQIWITMVASMVILTIVGAAIILLGV